MYSYRYYAAELFLMLKDGPIYGTIYLIGKKLGISYPSVEGLFKWIRKNPHVVGYDLIYINIGPTQHHIGITYDGMPAEYYEFMLRVKQSVDWQIVRPRLEQNERMQKCIVASNRRTMSQV